MSILRHPRRRLPATTPPGGGSSDAALVGLTVVDQGICSLSNFAPSLVVAHYGTARQFGIFALVYTTYLLTGGLVRGVTSDCLLTHGESGAARTRYEAGGYLASLVVSSAAGVLMLLATPFLAKDFAVPLAILAFCFPFLALQDYSRFIGIGRRDPGYAIALDSAWIALLVPMYVVLRQLGLVSLPWLVAGWTLSGALVGTWTLRHHLARGWRSLLRFWIDSERSVGLRFSGQFVVTSFSAVLVFYALALVISVAAVGTIKLAVLALAPITVMVSGIQGGLVTVATRSFRRSNASALRFLAVAALGMAMATAAWTVLVLAAPGGAARSVLGPNWPAARTLLPIAGVQAMLVVAMTPALSGLRALRAAKANLRTAMAILPFTFVGSVAGASLGGIRGFFVGSAIAAGFGLVVTWSVLVHVARRSTIGEAPSEAPSEAPPSTRSSPPWPPPASPPGPPPASPPGPPPRPPAPLLHLQAPR